MMCPQIIMDLVKAIGFQPHESKISLFQTALSVSHQKKSTVCYGIIVQQQYTEVWKQPELKAVFMNIHHIP